MCTFRIIFIGACNGLDFETKCEETATICEAVFATNGATCGTHCQSLGLICEGAWNDISGTCDKDTGSASGCGIEYSKQICRCITGKGKSIINHCRFLSKS